MNREELRDKLIEEAWEGLKNSYSPYSKFPVGAAVMGADGTVYRGCNIENVSYGLTVCGERTAIFNMVAHGCKTFTALAVVSKGNGDAALPAEPAVRCWENSVRIWIRPCILWAETERFSPQRWERSCPIRS